MAQADQTVQNATFPTVRADINDNLAALFSANSGGTAPSVTVAFQDWIDTSGANPIWKKRNASNNAWITLGTLSASTIAFEGTLPSQTGNAGEYLTTDGTVASWGAIPPGSTKEVFTSSGTWVKPTAGNIALITLWGGGGSGARRGGNTAGGGGGGACVQRLFQLSDLPGSAAVTIGAGGAAIASGTDAFGNVGGTSSFGSLINAYGGAGGSWSGSAGLGGGGGGSLGAGSGSSGGSGHSSTLTGANYNAIGGPGRGDYGGAAGDDQGTGATAFWGGGGGGGVTSAATQNAGGDSLNGGDGANSNTGTAASVPGGGGGASSQAAVASGAGGAGLCIVYIW
jgi:hypothetical protein